MLPGSHLISVEGLQEPWVVKSVTSRGQDVTDTGLEADARQRFDNVRITATDAATEVSGLVRDDNGTPVADAMVLVIPLAQQFWLRSSRRFGLLRTDVDGRFKIRGLPEGEYRVAASVDVDESDAFRVTVLDRLSQAGASLSLKPLEQRVLDLSLTDRTRARRASSR
jgi:carboxypeptidase family protein